MMRPMRSDQWGVRLECLGCGAHTTISPHDYRSSLEEGCSIWCSTCGSFQKVQQDKGRAASRQGAPAVAIRQRWSGWTSIPPVDPMPG
jgi:hypothetical protein